MMRISVIRAWPGRVEQATLELAPGATVGDALHAAGWGLDGGFTAAAVFGQAASVDTALRPGDRVELLRPLQLDPKQARRLRAERAKRRG